MASVKRPVPWLIFDPDTDSVTALGLAEDEAREISAELRGRVIALSQTEYDLMMKRRNATQTG